MLYTFVLITLDRMILFLYLAYIVLLTAQKESKTKKLWNEKQTYNLYLIFITTNLMLVVTEVFIIIMIY